MRILGVDPGSRAAGWALVEFRPAPFFRGAGVLRPATDVPFAERLRELHETLLAVISREKPDIAAVERVFSGVNPQSLITLGEARGAILLALSLSNVPVREITPAEIKRIVTGTGAAEKEQVRHMVKALLGASAPARLALDAADATAAALALGTLTARSGTRRVVASPIPLTPRRTNDPLVRTNDPVVKRRISG
ncbi:MAG: crossover junction endodeoxyribonuclease RuvC [Acidobacteria bacterium]|nr:crossover junction endodeoxyribonuclease RuvC [Acidobacteriota bacterium]